MILTINSGSSSLKYRLYTPDLSRVLASGLIARIGERDHLASLRYKGGRTEIREDAAIADHKAAFARMIQNLTHPDWGVIPTAGAITAVGHRAVHGGEHFVDSVLVTDAVLDRLEDCAVLAPLHNPANIAGIREARRLLPSTPQVVAFDTAFHQTMPPQAHVFALPYHLYTDHGIRRYGFHGLSCRHVSDRAAEVLGRPLEDLRMVICHLGNGVTIDAVQGGWSVDTSIGFGTFSGVMMGTRSGDVDPAVIFHLARELGMDLEEIERMCFRDSGLQGISGVGNDMRDILAREKEGNARCALAAGMFVLEVRKFIGAYAAAMGGLDSLVFTAGIGENCPDIRARICADLGFLGLSIDAPANTATVGHEGSIAADGSAVSVLVIPTDEERVIARDTLRLTAGAGTGEEGTGTPWTPGTGAEAAE